MLTASERLYLSKVFRKQRRSKRLSMAKVAKEAHISQVTIVKIEKGGSAKEGNYYRYGKHLNLQVMKLLVKYRKIHNKNYGNEVKVQFPYSVGKKSYELEGILTEMSGYNRVVIITLNKGLDYPVLSKDYPRIEKVAVERSKTKIIDQEVQEHAKNS